jgi:hypothetical protein
MTFVGRAKELETLSGLLEQAASGEPRIVWIQGPAGIGKTAILDEFAKRAKARGVKVAGTRITGPGVVDAYRPMKEIVATLVGVEPDEPEDKGGVWAPLKKKWMSLAGEALGVVPGLSLASLAVKIWGTVKECRDESKDQAAATETELTRRYEKNRVGLISDVIRGSALDEPVLVSVDDSQWADSGTVEVLLNLIRDLGESGRDRQRRPRILLALAVRPTDADGNHLDRIDEAIKRRFAPSPGCYAEQIHLGGVDPADIPPLVETLLGRACDTPAPFAEWLRRQNDGNPLRLQGMLSVMADHQLLVQQRGVYSLAEPFSASGKPPEALVRSLDVLRRGELATASELLLIPSSVRRFLEAGAIFGGTFPIDQASKMACLDDADQIEVLRDALRRGLVRESLLDVGPRTVPTATFATESHARFLAVQMPEAERRSFHLQAARWWKERLEAIQAALQELAAPKVVESSYDLQRMTLAERVAQWAPLVADGFAKAGMPIEALESLLAAEKAFSCGAFIFGNREDEGEFVESADRYAVNVMFRLVEKTDLLFEQYLSQTTWPMDRGRAHEIIADHALVVAAFFMEIEWYSRARNHLERAREVIDQYGLDGSRRRWMVLSASLAFHTRAIRDGRELVRDYARCVRESLPCKEELELFLGQRIGWEETPEFMEILKLLAESHRGDSPFAKKIAEAILEEDIDSAFGEGSEPWEEAARPAVDRLLADPDPARLAALLSRVEEVAELHFEDAIEEMPETVEERKAVVALFDLLATTAKTIGDDDLTVRARYGAVGQIASVVPNVTDDALSSLRPKDRKKMQQLLAAPPFCLEARRERAATMDHEAFIWDSEIVPSEEAVALVLDELGECQDLHSGYPCVFDDLVKRGDLDSLDVEPLLRWATKQADDPDNDPSLVVEVRKMVAEYFAAIGDLAREVEERLAAAALYRQAGDRKQAQEQLSRCSEIADELEDFDLRIELAKHGLLQGGSVAPPGEQPADIEDPLAIEEEAERAASMGDAAPEFDVAEAWYRRALHYYDRVPDGITRKDDILEKIADLWIDVVNGRVQIVDDGTPDEDDLLDPEEAAVKAKRALTEALAINEELGDTSRVHDLKWKLANLKLQTDGVEVYGMLVKEIVREDLRRGDLYYARKRDLDSVKGEIGDLREQLDDEDDPLTGEEKRDTERKKKALAKLLESMHGEVQERDAGMGAAK